MRIGIITTENRRHYANETYENLLLNGGHDVEILCDLKIGLYQNHVACWDYLLNGADEAILIQDDVLSAPNWLKAVTAIKNELSDRELISFFNCYSSGEPKHEGKYYIDRLYMWEQVIYKKKSFQDKFHATDKTKALEKFRIKKRENDFHHDCITEYVAKKNKCKVSSVFPPMFQHQNVKSSVGNPSKIRGKERKCEYFIGETDAYEFYKGKIYE